jgi:hypothetical protein
MPLLHHASLVVFADYHQFYVVDGGTHWDAPEDWSDEDLSNGAKVADQVVVVCPARNTHVPVEVEVFEESQEVDLEGIDHAITCSLHLPTGRLQIQECTGPERLCVSIPKGQYVVHVLFGGLSKISESGLEGEDFYRVLLWPSGKQPLKVLKQWAGDWRG